MHADFVFDVGIWLIGENKNDRRVEEKCKMEVTGLGFLNILEKPPQEKT